MWAALAGSWNLLAGYAGAVDLGPVVHHGVGAFVTAGLMLKAGLPFLVSVVLAGLVAMAVAFAVGTPTLRLRGAYFAIGTLALAESAKQLALVWDRLTRIPLTGGSAGISLPLSAGYVLFYYVMLALMVGVTAGALWLGASKFGYGLRAVGENDRLAEGRGVKVLEVRSVTKQFGSLAALNRVDLAVEEGEILAIIGPNGAGKSTLFNVIAGLMPPTSGAVYYRGRPITGLSTDAVCRLGVAKTFQIPQLFPRLSVAENVLVAALYGKGAGLAEGRREAAGWLGFVGLADKAAAPAETLTLGERRRADP